MANQRGRHPSKSSSSFGKHQPKSGSGDPSRAAKLRIIAGTHRGRTLVYRGDPVTRPMKDRTREALFSRLGGKFDSGIAVDLFAGTGVLGFESLSRGATEAWLVELDSKAATDIRQTAKQLGFDTQAHVRCGDSFLLAEHIIQQLQQSPTPSPWLVFVCPPYALWQEQHDAMHQLLQRFCASAPEGSSIVCELEEKTPLEILPNNLEWDVRLYRPAQVAIADIQK